MGWWCGVDWRDGRGGGEVGLAIWWMGASTAFGEGLRRYDS